MPNERANDKAALIECLNIIESELQHIVFEMRERFRKEFLEDFPGPWKEVQLRFDTARKQIQDDNLDWHYVEGVGLTKSTLIWKRDLLRKAQRTGVLRRFLDMADSFLGSLSDGLPIIEFIKEYQDMVEASLKIVRWSFIPATSVNLRWKGFVQLQ